MAHQGFDEELDRAVDLLADLADALPDRVSAGRDFAAELADLSKQISADIDEGGKDVISARIFERLDRIERLTKRIREKAKGTAASIPKVN